MSFIEDAVGSIFDKGISSLTDRLFGRSDNFNEQMEHNSQSVRNTVTTDIQSRVDAAKSRGLHPLAALGVNVASASPVIASSSGSYSGLDRERVAMMREQLASENKLRDAQAFEAFTAGKRNMADAYAAMHIGGSMNALAGQPGNPPPIVEEVPNQVTRHKKGDVTTTGGYAPSEGRFVIRDAYGEPQAVRVPSKDYGQTVEQMGEIWQAILSAPYGMDILAKTYLQTPLSYLRKFNKDMSEKRHVIDRAFTDFPWTRLQGVVRE